MARELYMRLSTMGDHLSKVGTSLGAAVTAYNRAIGSLEARVLVSARKLAELGVSGDALATPTQVEVAARALQAPELVDSEYAALLVNSDERPP
jgi:DNA recombination protein RmuC